MVRTRRLRLKKIVLSVSVFISCTLLVVRTTLRRKQPLSDLPPIPTVAPFPAWAFDPISLPGYALGTADACRAPHPTLLAIVHSSPTHLSHRRAIRRTWGRPDGTIRTVFVVGRSPHPQIRQRVRIEAEEHGDLVLPDVPDSYHNLTVKHIAGLRWALQNCPDATYIMKADDDVFVDVKRATKILSSASMSDDVIACRVVPEGSVPRRSGKWTVTREEYPPPDYPEYCSGLAYFGRPAALRKVLASALSGKVPRLWIDDVFVTGLSAKYAGIRFLDLGVWYARDDWIALERLRKHGTMPWIVVEMQPRHWPSDAIDMWRMANDGNP